MVALLVISCSLAVANPAAAAPAEVRSRSATNSAAGTQFAWDLSAVDATYKTQLEEFWVLDAHSAAAPFVLAFPAADLATPRRVEFSLPEEFANGVALGLAEIPIGGASGNNALLIDNAFLQQSPDPHVGVFDNDGSMIAEFVLVEGTQGARLTSMAFHPSAEQIVVYDSDTHAVYFLDFFFSVTDGPFPLLGVPHFTIGPWLLGNQPRGSGVGLAFNSDDTFLATAGIVDAWRTPRVAEYRASDAGYSGRMIDLSGAVATGVNELTFAHLAVGAVNEQPTLFSVNLPAEAAISYDLEFESVLEPVALTCDFDDELRRYELSWSPPTQAGIDEVVVIENGVEIATLPPNATSYVSEGPLVGKLFVSVATSRGGLRGAVTPACEFSNTQTVGLPEIEFDGIPLPNGDYRDLAATKTPASVDDFRLYQYIPAIPSAFVSVFDHALESTDVLTLREPSIAGGGVGIAFMTLDDAGALAVLDSNGFDNGGQPSAAFFAVDGEQKGTALMRVDAVDTGAVASGVVFDSWDVHEGNGETYFVAYGRERVGGADRHVLVRFDLSGQDLTAVARVPVPHRALSGFEALQVTGRAVCVLPGGSLLVGGSDTFKPVFTDAYLSTPFGRDSATAAKFVGFSQSLLRGSEFVGLGPSPDSASVLGLATAFFADVGIGATFHPISELPVISHPTGASLSILGDGLIVQESVVAHPNLLTEQLLETELSLAGNATTAVPRVVAGRTFGAGSIDYYLTLVNLDTVGALPLEIRARLDGASVAIFDRDVVLAPGRHFRMGLPGRSETSVEFSLRNSRGTPATVRAIVGATAIATGSDPFRRGDCNVDGVIDISDGIFGLTSLFAGGDQPTCRDACDTNDDAVFDLADMVNVLNHLFRGNTPLAPPATCGADPTADDPFTMCEFRLCR